MLMDVLMFDCSGHLMSLGFAQLSKSAHCQSCRAYLGFAYNDTNSTVFWSQSWYSMRLQDICPSLHQDVSQWLLLCIFARHEFLASDLFHVQLLSLLQGCNYSMPWLSLCSILAVPCLVDCHCNDGMGHTLLWKASMTIYMTSASDISSEQEYCQSSVEDQDKEFTPDLPPCKYLFYLCRLEALSSYIAELSLLEYESLRALPSTIAAAAVLLAQFCLYKACWTRTLQHYSTYSPHQLRSLLLFVIRVWHYNIYLWTVLWCYAP